MNRAGVLFEGWSSRHLYNTKLRAETPKLSPGFKEKYHDEKQKYLGEMLRTWYLKVAGDKYFIGPDFSACSFSIISVPVSKEGRGSEERREYTSSERLPV